MKIDFVKNRFIIDCHFNENHLINGVPSKRFDRKSGVWYAQNLNRNCRWMLDNLSQYMTDLAISEAESTIKLVTVRYEKFPSWYKFKTKPFGHQLKAMDFSYGLSRYALFMEMGTGKSKTVIDTYSAHFMTGAIDAWVVFCPVDIKLNWSREIKAHCPLDDIPVFIIESGKKGIKTAKEAASRERFIAIIGIESFSVGEKKGSAYEACLELVVGRKFGATLDESHNCKSPDSNRSKNIGHLCQNAKVMNIMTGTPTSLGFIDLFMQFEIMNPNILGFGSYYAFRSRYAVMGGYENKQIVTYQNVDELMDLIRPHTFQCTKEEALDLPPKTYTIRTVEMSPEQKKAYAEIEDEMYMAIPNPKDAAAIEIFVEHAMTKYGILQQITGGFVNYDDPELKITLDKNGDQKFKKVRRASAIVDPSKNPKIQEVLKISEEHPERSIIIWAKYRQEIKMITEALSNKWGDCCAEYHGGIDRDIRMSQVDDFNNRKKRFFVSNPQTGGTGLNLVVSDLVVYYSNDFQLVKRKQSEDRAHRIGQKSNNVLYIDLFCEGTKDMDIYAAIESKQDLAQYLKNKLKSGDIDEL